VEGFFIDYNYDYWVLDISKKIPGPFGGFSTVFSYNLGVA